MTTKKAAQTAAPAHAWIVFAYLEGPDCGMFKGKDNIAVFLDGQAAKVEAGRRSVYGYKRQPQMHIEKVEISTESSARW